MGATLRQLHSFLARSVYMFLLYGTMKSYGVTLEKTVNSSGSNHALIGVAFSLQLAVGFLAAPPVKVIYGFLGSRLSAVLGGTIITAGFIFRALVSPTNIWYLLLIIAVTGCGFGVVDFVTVVSLEECFDLETFPTVYSVASMISFFGVASLPPSYGYFVRNIGEREGMLMLGIATSTMIIIGALTPSSVRSSNIANDGSTETSAGSDETNQLIERNEGCQNIPESSRSLEYWVLFFRQHPTIVHHSLLLALKVYANIAWSIFLVPYGEALGLDPATAVWLSTAGGLAGVLGKVCIFVIYRWESMILPLGAVFPTILIAVSYVISLLSDNVIALMFTASGSGFSIALWASVGEAWLPRVVCSDHFRGAVTLSFSVAGVATLLGATITGAVIDLTGSYRWAFATHVVLCLLGSLISVIWIFSDRHLTKTSKLEK